MTSPEEAPTDGQIARFVNLHLETAQRDSRHKHREREWVYKVNGKERPMLVVTALSENERGSRWFLVLPITSDPPEYRRSKLIRIGNCIDESKESFVEPQLYKLPEELLRRAAGTTQIHPLLFQGIFKKLGLYVPEGQMQFKPIKGFPHSDSDSVDMEPESEASTAMIKYEFIVHLADLTEVTEEAANALFEAGCDDASPASRDGQVWSTFHREAPSLEHAIRSTVADVNKAGYRVQRIELDPTRLQNW